MVNNPNLKPFNLGYDPRRGRKPKGAKNLAYWIKKLLDDPKFEITMLDVKGQPYQYKGAPVKALITVAIQRAITDQKEGYKWADWLAKHGYVARIDIAEANREDPIPIMPIYSGISQRPDLVEDFDKSSLDTD